MSALIVVKPDVGAKVEHQTVHHEEAEFISFTAKEKFSIEVYLAGKLKHHEVIMIDSIKDGEIKKDLLIE